MAFQNQERDENGDPTEDAYLGAAMTADYQLHVVAFIEGITKAPKAPPSPRRRRR